MAWSAATALRSAACAVGCRGIGVVDSAVDPLSAQFRFRKFAEIPELPPGFDSTSGTATAW